MSQLEYVPKELRDKRDSKIIRQVRDRDFGKCQCCGFKGSEVHHIHPHHLGGKTVPENLILLCARCHEEAPDDPDKFLAYQKSGGANFLYSLGYVLMRWSQDSPESMKDTTLEKYLEDAYVRRAVRLWAACPFLTDL
ncbi:MAG TPA: HNH endonuclease signature motif containing protein [Allocoleopsis sp.]